MKYPMTFPFNGYMITGMYYPATPDVHYMRNGDPGYPGEDSDFNVTSITREGVDIPLEVFFPDPEENDLMYTQLCDEIALAADAYDTEQQNIKYQGAANDYAEMKKLPPSGKK